MNAVIELADEEREPDEKQEPDEARAGQKERR